MRGEIAGQAIAVDKNVVVTGVVMDSTSESRVWRYMVSTDPPSAWHYGEAWQHTRVDERDLSPLPVAPGTQPTAPLPSHPPETWGGAPGPIGGE